MLDDWRRERRIRKVLVGIKRQRVAVKKGELWALERALPRNNEVEADIGTCLIRGWIEPLRENMPTGPLLVDGEVPREPYFNDVQTFYRMTDSGWAALNRAHEWTVFAAIVGAAGFGAAIATLL